MVEKELRLRTPLEELDLLFENKDNINMETDASASEVPNNEEPHDIVRELDTSAGGSVVSGVSSQ